MGILDFLEEDSAASTSPPPLVEVLTSVVPAPQVTGQLLTREEQVDSHLRELENNLLENALTQLNAAQKWAEVLVELDPEDVKQIPQKWIDELGEEKAREQYRIARAASMPSAKAPAQVKENAKLAVGILKARAHEKTGPRILNLNLVEMPNVVLKFPEQEVK